MRKEVIVLVTLKDVAERAGVNASTVSRTLKDSSSISAKTKEKVRKAIAELGYVSNVTAARLASGLTKAVGLVLPPMTTPDRITNPFFMEILAAVNDEARQHDLTISIAIGNSLEDLFDQVSLMFKQKLVDGFIVLYSEKGDPVSQYLKENDIPFVIVGQAEELMNEVTFIDNDNQLMARTAVDYLYEKGHRRILFVTDDRGSEIYLERYFGYVRGVSHLDLPIFDSGLFDRHLPESLDDLMSHIKKNDVTAVIVIDDMLAVRFMQFLSFYGLKVPDDISMISFNNSTYARMVHPYLTSFDINIETLGRTSLQRLLRKIENRSVKAEKVIVPFELKERESVRYLTDR